jgi:hypothetical protein
MQRQIDSIGMIIAACVMLIVGFLLIEQRVDMKVVRHMLEQSQR